MQALLNSKDYRKKIDRIGQSVETDANEASAYDMLIYRRK